MRIEDDANDRVPGPMEEEDARLWKVFRKLCFLSRSLDEAEALAGGGPRSPGVALERGRRVVTLENIEEHLERESAG